MRVIGTAGHVDHGKSTLVQALTGTHPDRLKEEREREMTIDLGFAWMKLSPDEWLPAGEDVGIVDVPGHRDFIENMLSGVGGIDAVLFVVAADEGVMPQTREHLAILNILQIEAGVIALTKIDLVQDQDWLELVEDDIRRVCASTVLSDAPIIRVSSRTRQGISELLEALSACLAKQPPRLNLGRPRLPVDRVFTMAGFGTIVTGTLIDGSLHTGDEVLVLGSDHGELRGRVRGLQTHKVKEDLAVPGSRTAVNLTGVEVDQVQRGNVVVHPGDYSLTRLLDVRFRLLPDARQNLTHGSEVKFFTGAAEVIARVRLLGVEELLPGEEAWLQLDLLKPVVAMRGDRYILRRPSPGETLGGGFIIDHQPKHRHKRFAKATLDNLEALTKGTPADILLQASTNLGIAPLQDVLVRSNLSNEAADKALQELTVSSKLVYLENNPSQGISRQTLVVSKFYWEQQVQSAIQAVDSYHKSFPLRRGLPKEELKSRLKASARWFPALLRAVTATDEMEETGTLIRRKGFTIQFNPAQQRQVDGLLMKFKASPYSPPTAKECLAEVNEDIYNALVDLDELVPIPPDVVFRRQDYDKMVAEIKQMLTSQGTLTAAQVRDHFNTSRRYVLAVLENLDSQGVTIRDGDLRRLKRP